MEEADLPWPLWDRREGAWKAWGLGVGMEAGESLDMGFTSNNVMLMFLFKVCGIVDSSKETRIGSIVNN